jgi:hypothetical protein
MGTLEHRNIRLRAAYATRLAPDLYSTEGHAMSSLAIEGFYTLCLRDAMRPGHSSMPALARAASDLVAYAKARAIDQAGLLAELDRASHSVEWVTSFEIAVHTEALALGRAAIQQAYEGLPDLGAAQGSDSSPNQSSTRVVQSDDLFR